MGRTGDHTDSVGDRRPGWSRSPWLWTVAVVVVVGGALGLSLVVGTDALDPEVGDEDTTALCEAVRTFARTAALTGEVDPSGASLAADAAALEGITPLAPESIQGTITELARATRELGARLSAIESREGPGTPAASEATASAVEAFDRRQERVVTRLTNYLRNACGFDWRRIARLEAEAAEIPGIAPAPTEGSAPGTSVATAEPPG